MAKCSNFFLSLLFHENWGRTVGNTGNCFTASQRRRRKRGSPACSSSPQNGGGGGAATIVVGCKTRKGVGVGQVFNCRRSHMCACTYVRSTKLRSLKLQGRHSPRYKERSSKIKKSWPEKKIEMVESEGWSLLFLSRFLPERGGGGGKAFLPHVT